MFEIQILENLINSISVIEKFYIPKQTTSCVMSRDFWLGRSWNAFESHSSAMKYAIISLSFSRNVHFERDPLIAGTSTIAQKDVQGNLCVIKVKKLRVEHKIIIQQISRMKSKESLKIPGTKQIPSDKFSE